MQVSAKPRKSLILELWFCVLHKPQEGRIVVTVEACYSTYGLHAGASLSVHEMKRELTGTSDCETMARPGRFIGCTWFLS